MVVSSIVHGVIYDVIWKAMRGLGLGGSIVAAVAVLLVVSLIGWLFQAIRG